MHGNFKNKNSQKLLGPLCHSLGPREKLLGRAGFYIEVSLPSEVLKLFQARLSDGENPKSGKGCSVNLAPLDVIPTHSAISRRGPFTEGRVGAGRRQKDTGGLAAKGGWEPVSSAGANASARQKFRSPKTEKTKLE
jgi:hypothetical protein